MRSSAPLSPLTSLALVAALASPLLAQPDTAAERARAHLARQSASLGLAAADLEDLVVTNQVPSRKSGVTHVYLQQRLDGIEVANGRITVSVSPDGSTVGSASRLVGNLAQRVNTRQPSLAAEDGLRAASAALGLGQPSLLRRLGATVGTAMESRLSAPAVSIDEIPAKLVYYALDSGEVRLSWQLSIRTPDQRHWWQTWIDAETGELLAKVDWISWDTYEVFAIPRESPSDGPRTIEGNPADALASPFGWHDTNGVAGGEFTTTRGNNVCAQEDRNADNSACGTGFQPSSATLDFQYPLDLATQQPVDYQPAAITNLFYWNNVMHDVLYQYGFDEPSGNFQENNYGRGGLDSDSVNADAQDGSGTNNANFATPPEPNGPFSTNPRMQMFEWTSPFANELVVASGSAAGTYTGSDAAFGPALDTTGVAGDIILANDGSGTPTDGCEAFPGGFFTGDLALVDRGTCSFVTKVRNAQNAGATGVVVANNVSGNPIPMGDDGTGGDITIPSMMISLADGQTVRSGLPSTGTARRSPDPAPNRDSDLDNGVIAHEYCHGVSIRLTGGPSSSSCLSGDQQGGEGWSDFCALFVTADAADTGTTPRGVGTYVSFEPATGPGIRTYPYSTDIATNPLTYGDLTTGTLSIPHGVGTVWATALWEMYWELVGAHGFDSDLYTGTGGNNLAMQLVIDGLKGQPCNPTFLDARDAILAADQANNSGANECLIWQAFAKRGMGFSAADGGSSNSLSVTEAFDLPPSCVVGCGNGICESGEDCNTCPGDCASGTSSGAVCGNGVCEAGNGEDCVTCAADCNGVQSGKPSNRFCCGGGGGANPVACSDARCSSGGFSCTDVPVPGGSFCCGDLSCDSGESCGNCALDCTIGAEVCFGGLDEDCNGFTDCADNVCSSDPLCQGGGCTLGQPGDSCTVDSDCCSNKCKGKPGSKTCN